MNRVLKTMMMLAALAGPLAIAAAAQNTQSTNQQPPPPWIQRGIPGAGHAALAPLVGSWRVELSIYGTMGRSPDLPPIISQDVPTTRIWIADGQHIETQQKAQWMVNRTGAGGGSDITTSIVVVNG